MVGRRALFHFGAALVALAGRADGESSAGVPTAGSAGVSPASLVTPGPQDFGTSALGGEFVLLEGTPPPPNPPDDGEFDPEAEDAAIRLDASSTATSEPPSLEGGELGGGGSQQMSGGGGPTIVAEREYVWGPDYVDECVVQFDTDNVAFYVLQDANYNVVALLKADGLPAVQYTYEPYGALQLAESFTQHPVNRLGHQGLFFERLDAGPYDPALVPGARGLCHARNRWYDPVTGRWTTRDPNETALPVITATAMNGQSLDIVFGPFELLSHYGDGMNLYAYLGSNPANGFDPLGLSEFDLLVVRDWDNIWESIVGNGSAYLGVQGAATWGAAWGGNVASLPQFAGHMMGVSQGFSDFADAYAEEVIWLPISAGVQGFAAFNSVAKVSASQSRRFGAFAAVGAVGKLADEGYDSFAALKRAIGPAGSGKVWHHIVEQSKAGLFGMRRIQNAKNVKAVKMATNQKLNALYSSIRPGITKSSTMTVREWLAGKSFEFNRKFGLKAIKMVEAGTWP
jgi:hypothetical protein